MALTRITKGVIKPNENYDTHNINSTGIVTSVGLDVNGNADISGSLSVGGVLTYEDVTSIDSVGIITAQKDIHVGAGLSVVGVGSFGSLDISGDIDVDGHTELDNVNIVGVTTHNGQSKFYGNGGAPLIWGDTGYSGHLSFDGSNNAVVRAASGKALVFQTNHVNTRMTIGSQGNVSINNDLDVDGHTNLDNVSIAGVTTTSTVNFATNARANFASNNRLSIHSNGTNSYLDYAGSLNVRGSSGSAAALSFLSDSNVLVSNSLSINDDLDVDGHTELDNVNIAGVTTFTEAIYPNQGSYGTATAGKIKQYNNQLYIQGGTGGIMFANHANNRWQIDSSGYFMPVTDSTFDIGDNTTRVRNIYADTLYGDGSNLTGVNANVGITTNLSGTFTASAGSPSTINTFGYGSGDIVVEYTVFIKNGSDFQSQKLLAMRDGTTIHSTQFAVMYSSSLLVQLDATISSGNILLRATPETGVSGSTTYKVKREVM